MTTQEIVGVLLRRWYVVAIGLLCALFVIIAFGGPSRYYTVQNEFVFVGPGDLAISGLPDDQVETLTDFAGIVGDQYNATHETEILTSPTATLFGNGFRKGVSVRLGDSGSQWVHSYNRPVLVVQVMGPDAAEVENTLETVGSDLSKITSRLQDETHVRPKERISVFNDTRHTVVGSFGNSRTSRAKAAGIILLVGLAVSGAAAAWLDQTLRRRRGLPDPLVRPRLNVSGCEFGTGRQDIDAVTFLTMYLLLACALPSYLVIPALGEIGRPSILWGLAGIVWWIYHRLQQPTHLPIGPRAVHRSLWLFLSFALLGLAKAYFGGLPSTVTGPADAGLLRLLSWTGVTLVALNGIPTRKRLLTLLRRITLVAGLMAVLGLVQFATGQSFVDSLTLPGFSVSTGFDSIQGRAGFVRAAGTASHPLEYASVLCMALPIGAILGATDRHRHPLLRWWAPLTISIAILMSVSRSAIIGAAAGLILLLPAIPPRLRLKAAGVGAVMLVAVLLLVPGMIGTLRGLFLDIGHDSSSQSRDSGQAAALAIAARHPILGNGFGTFLPQDLIMDNEYLGLMIEIGFVGCAIFLLAMLAAIWTAWTSGRRTARDPWQQIGPAVAASMVAGATTLAFFDGLSFPMTGALLFVLFGVAGAVDRLLENAGDLPVTDQVAEELPASVVISSSITVIS